MRGLTLTKVLSNGTIIKNMKGLDGVDDEILQNGNDFGTRCA